MTCPLSVVVVVQTEGTYSFISPPQHVLCATRRTQPFIIYDTLGAAAYSPNVLELPPECLSP